MTLFDNCLTKAAGSALMLAAIFLGAPGCAHGGPRLEADYVFENVNIVPMNEEIVLPDRAVAVKDGIIIGIVDEEEAQEILTEHRVDGQGYYLLPGFADMHVHLRMNPQAFFDLQLANGVTTVHNMGNADGGGAGRGAVDHVALRADVAAGRIDGPRYLISGPQLEAEQLPGLAAVTAVLDEHIARGFDTMKVHGDLAPDVYDALIKGARARGIRVTGHAQHMMPLAQTLRMDALEHMEEFLYMSRDEVFGEAAVGNVDNYLDAYRANIARLADPGYRQSIVQDVAASGIYMDPTLIIYTMLPTYISDERFKALHDDPRLAYLPQRTRDSYLDPDSNEYRAGLAPLFRAFLKRVGDDTPLAAHFDHNIDLLSQMMVELHDAGVPLLLGSDAFGALVPGFAAHQELALMVDAGLSPYEALRTGTVNVAAYLGEADRAGTVETGKRADFVLVARNPMEDIGNAADIRGVFSHGRWRSKTDIEQLRANARAIAEQE